MTQQTPRPGARPGGRLTGPQAGTAPRRLREFTYKRWGSGERTVHAADVTFEPTGHVVFRDPIGRIVLAERKEQVNELREAGADTGVDQ